MVSAVRALCAVSVVLAVTAAQADPAPQTLSSSVDITYLCPGRSQHAMSLTCGMVGKIRQASHTFRGTVTSLNQCAAACYSLPLCKSFSYNSLEGKICSIYNEEFPDMMFEKTTSRTRFFNRDCFDCRTIDASAPTDTTADRSFILSVAVRSWLHNRNATEYASIVSPTSSPDDLSDDEVLLLRTTTSRSEATTFRLSAGSALVWADTGLEARIGNYPGICRSIFGRSTQVRFSGTTSDKLATLMCDIVGGEIYCSYDCFQYFTLWGEVGTARWIMAETNEMGGSGVAFDVHYV